MGPDKYLPQRAPAAACIPAEDAEALPGLQQVGTLAFLLGFPVTPHLSKVRNAEGRAHTEAWAFWKLWFAALIVGQCHV